MESHRDYRSVLKFHFETRIARNPRYSLRAFARDLQLSPSRLSDVLKGRYGLSRGAAEGIAGRLSLSETERDHFCNLVESQHSRDPQRKKCARAKVKRVLIEQSSRAGKTLNLEHFQIISHWYHFAILELCYLEGFKNDLNWISGRLGLRISVVIDAVERLKRVGCLRQNRAGHLRPVENFTWVGNNTPSAAIREFHRQVLGKAQEALDSQSMAEREFNALVVSIEGSRLEEARKELQEFRDRFCEKFGNGSKKDRVYCLGIQFFDLLTSKNGGKDEK